MKSKAVITGMGVVTPLGKNIQDFFNSLVTGQSGIGSVNAFDLSCYKTKQGAFVPDDGDKHACSYSTFLKPVSWIIHCLEQALQQAALTLNDLTTRKSMLILGSFLGELGTQKRNAPYNPHAFDKITQEVIAYLAQTVPSITLTNACASGIHVAGLGSDMINTGKADLVIAGAYEVLGDFTWAGMECIRSLGTRLRPFDAKRNGTILGEGAGILILEDYRLARKRKVPIRAEMAGYGCANDNHHCLRPHPEAAGLSQAVEIAINESELTLTDIDYIQAHGTGTLLNDAMETLAIKKIFGARAKEIPVSSIKGNTGHMLGASGILSIITAVLALEHKWLPPTHNYENPDPACDLDYIPDQGRRQAVRNVLCNAAGFGGVNGSLVLCLPSETSELLPETTCLGKPALNVSLFNRTEPRLDCNDFSDWINNKLIDVMRKLDPDTCDKKKCGLVFDAGSGLYDSQYRFYTQISHNPRYAEPSVFSFTFPNRFTGEITKKFNLTGPCFTICDSGKDLDTAFLIAQVAIQLKKAENMLVIKFMDPYLIILTVSKPEQNTIPTWSSDNFPNKGSFLTLDFFQQFNKQKYQSQKDQSQNGF